MEPVDIVLTKDTFEVLAPGTRLDMLKTLSPRRMTVTELADSLDLAKSTVHHHLQRLADAGLVTADDGGHAWVYYVLAMIGESQQQRTSLWMRESRNLYIRFSHPFDQDRTLSTVLSHQKTKKLL